MASIPSRGRAEIILSLNVTENGINSGCKDNLARPGLYLLFFITFSSKWFEPRSISSSSSVIEFGKNCCYIDWQTLFIWLWRWLPLRLSKRLLQQQLFSELLSLRRSHFTNVSVNPYFVLQLLSSPCLIQRSWLQHSCSLLFRHGSSNYKSHLCCFAKLRYLWTTWLLVQGHPALGTTMVNAGQRVLLVLRLLLR